MKFIKEQKKGRGDAKANTNTAKKQTSGITWKEVNFEREDVCKGQVVERGMKGEIVWWVQTGLSYDDPTITPDYKFGSGTEKDVVAFQLKNKDKLKVTGKVDKDTWNLLFEGSSHACEQPKKIETKPEEKKDDKMKNTDDKPKELENKIKKGPKIVKGVWIGEQSAKPAVKQDPKKVALVRATRVKDNQGKSCIDRFVAKYKLKPSEYGDTINELEDGGWAVIYRAINPKTKVEDDFYITSDGSRLFGIYGDDSSEVDIYCDDQDFNLGEFGNLSERQKQFIQYNVTPESGYKKGVSPGEEEYYDKVDITKIFKGASEYFTPNQYFVYKRKGFKVPERNEEFYTQVESMLNKVGWTYKKPDINTEAYSTKKDIRVQFPKYNELFPEGLYIYFTGNTLSTPERTIVTKLISDIEKSVAKPEGKTCRDAINTLWDAKNNYERGVIYFSGDTELEMVREYVKRCQRNFEENIFNRVLGGGTKKKFEELKSKKYGPKGAMKFNLSENFNSLIKQRLLELKEKKENNKVINNIVENRLKMVAESFKKGKNIEKVSTEFMFELKEFNQQGLVNESFGETLKNIFGSELSSMPKTFFENIFDKILTKIDMNDSSLKKVLVMASEKNPSEMVKAFKDCDSMANLISKSISEILYSNINSGKVLSGQGLNSIKNLLGSEIKKDEFVQKIKNVIDDTLCQEFTILTTNSEKVLSKLKGNSKGDFSVEL